jgi:hypothetical protein
MKLSLCSAIEDLSGAFLFVPVTAGRWPSTGALDNSLHRRGRVSGRPEDLAGGSAARPTPRGRHPT